jgi:hypothetical protein
MTDQSKNLEPMINIKSKENIDNLEEDIDFLLSLKEPVQSNITIIKQPVSISRNNGKILYHKDISTIRVL